MLGARFRKLSVCIALTANSIRSSIGSLFFHGMPRFYLTTPPKSVTYVLNLLCYLCSEPAPSEFIDQSNRPGRLVPVLMLMLMLVLVLSPEMAEVLLA